MRKAEIEFKDEADEWDATEENRIVHVRECEPFGYFSSDEEVIPLDHAIKALCAVRDAVPEPFRASAVLRVAAYGDAHSDISVRYRIPETDAERNDRIENEQANKSARERAKELRERTMYENLKRKYG